MDKPSTSISGAFDSKRETMAATLRPLSKSSSMFARTSLEEDAAHAEIALLGTKIQDNSNARDAGGSGQDQILNGKLSSLMDGSDEAMWT